MQRKSTKSRRLQGEGCKKRRCTSAKISRSSGWECRTTSTSIGRDSRSEDSWAASRVRPGRGSVRDRHYCRCWTRRTGGHRSNDADDWNHGGTSASWIISVSSASSSRVNDIIWVVAVVDPDKRGSLAEVSDKAWKPLHAVFTYCVVVIMDVVKLAGGRTPLDIGPVPLGWIAGRPQIRAHAEISRSKHQLTRAFKFHINWTYRCRRYLGHRRRFGQ